MIDQQLLSRLALAEKHFTAPEYKQIVEAAKNAYGLGLPGKLNHELNRLPTAEKLLETLVEKLRGKSVYKTLKQIQDGKSGDNLVNMTGLSSLMTHVLIEMRQGHREYGILIPYIFEQLAKMVYTL